MTSKRWTLAEIKQANEAAGRFFFSPATMKAYGDTMASFKVRHYSGNRVFIERVRPMIDRDGVNHGGVGELREFNPQTGEIGIPLKGILWRGVA